MTLTEPKAPHALCHECPARARQFVPAQTLPESKKPRLAIVGEAPGWEEKRDGVPFVGSSGKLLQRYLDRGNVSRSEVHWTNAVLCAASKEELLKARKCCEKRLHEELKASGAQTVLAVGAIGFHSTCGLKKDPKIQGFRGAVLESTDPLRTDKQAYTVVASLHPAFILRTPVSSPSWEHVFANDVARAVDIADNGYVPPERLPGKRIVVAKSFDVLERELPLLEETIVVDIETCEKEGRNRRDIPPDIHTNRLTCLVISDVNTAVVIPVSVTLAGEGKFWGDAWETRVVPLVNETLKTRISVTHNGPAYDHIGLRRAGIQIARWEDSLNAYHVITSYFPKNLRHVVSCYVAAPPWKDWPHGEALETQWHYNGQDGLYNALAWRELRASMDEDDLRVYEHDKKNAELCTRMSENGFAFDSAKAEELHANLLRREEELNEEARTLTGDPKFNVRSTPQLGRFFFKTCGINVLEKTKGGEPSVNKGVMRALVASKDERVSRMALITIEARSVRKCRGTYIRSKKWKVHTDGRVRATWQSWGTISGRWSAKAPNLANQPTKRADPSLPWGGIRSLYVAGEGRCLVYFDAKQMEFRVAAYASGDPNMIAVCEDPVGDIHTANAIMLFGDGFLNGSAEMKKGLRDLAKRAVFAVNYFADAETIYGNLVAEGNPIKLEAVKTMCATMKRRFTQYYVWQAAQLDATIRNGYVESPLLGRKRWLGHVPKPTDNANFPIQSGAADTMNPKLQKIETSRASEGLDALLVAMVYDSATWDCAPKDSEALCEIIRSVWAEPTIINGRSMVIPVDVKVGFRWSDF